ncbi:MAG: hypothetical protein K9L64_04295 [Candidatus Izimaplasma sp.]|nr:hypothetical protein [Candidatus Izimaplasma bacterium]
MKIRTGFVSNSSSSSFIIGFFEVKDTNKFNDYLTRSMISEYDYLLFKGSDLNNNDFKDRYAYRIEINEEEIVIRNFQTDIHIERDKIDAEKNYMVLNYEGNEGDDTFWNESYQDYEYDIDLSYFKGTPYGGLLDLNNEVIQHIDYLIGAGRNG